jgi:hypothetical protein
MTNSRYNQRNSMLVVIAGGPVIPAALASPHHWSLAPRGRALRSDFFDLSRIRCLGSYTDQIGRLWEQVLILPLARVLSFVALTATPAGAASIYYLSPQGSDTSDGRSPATAWQTIGKINATRFGPGDSLLIDSSHGAFSGCLQFTSANVTSTDGNPFVVGAYGGGSWVLNSNCGSDGNASAAVTINGVSGIIVQDGVLSGNGSRTLYGVWIMNTFQSGPADSITIQRMDISDFNTSLTTNSSSEIFITGYPGNGLTDVKIIENNLHGSATSSLDDNGITGYGNGLNITAIYSRNRIYNIGGMTGRAAGTTGNGIWCNGTSSCEVAHNYIHDIGANVNQCGGPVGIGTYTADNSYIHGNEVHHVHATGWNSVTCDFAALDADGKSTNGIWERNYTHHNDGPAFVFGGSPPASPWGPNQFRLNISEEDNLQNTDGGGIWSLSGTSGGYAYNNTAYRSLNPNGSISFCVFLGYSGTYGASLFANNTCTNKVIVAGYSGAVSYANSYNQSSPAIINNNYFVAGTPVFFWLGKKYMSLIAFQAATGKDARSTTVDPVLLAPGDGGDCGGILDGICPRAYELGTGSPMVGDGAGLAQFGIPLPLTGYYGTAFENIRGYNVGADSGIMASCAPGNNRFRAQACSTLNTAHDFNGDGRSDILWRDTVGDVAVWLMNGVSVLSSGEIDGVSLNWSLAGQRDFNDDGKADLLWRDAAGDTSIWFMNGTRATSSASIGNVPTNRSVVGVADFNGDGIGDLLWRDNVGDLAVWLMSSATVTSSAALGNVPTTWTVVGTGDFDGDGVADILWQDNLGDTAIWFMNGTTVASSAGIGSIPNWSVVGTGDFNGDGKSDIVWRDIVGNTSIWLMNGAAVSSVGGLGNVPTTWSIVQTGDYNGDRMSDLLWRDNLGNTAMWFMNGTNVASSAGVGNIPTNWTVQMTNAE